MRKIFLLVSTAAWLVLGWSLLANVSPVRAQTPPPPVSLSVTPSSVELAQNQKIQLVVVATIPVTTVRAISLTAFTDVGIATIIHADAPPASPRGAVTWLVDVQAVGSGPRAGTLYFRADYMYQVDSALVPGIAFAQVTVQARQLDPLSSILDAQIDTTLETLKDQQTGQAYLRISNLTDVPITITDIELSVPSFLSPTVTPALPITLQARQTRALEYQFRAQDAVVPGKHLLVYQVQAEWTRNANQVQGSLVVTRSLSFEVIGQEFVSFAQIPSLLLLPGIIAVAMFIVLYRRAYPKTDPGFDLTKPEFWLAAVLVSMLALLVYTPLTTWLAQLLPGVIVPRNYLQAYGLRDLIALWLGAMLFGLLVWAIWGSIKRWQERREAERLKGLQISQVDTPADVLRVLGNYNASLNLQPVKYVKQAQGQPAQIQQVFRLPVTSSDATKTWVMPQIRVFWQMPTDEFKNELSSALRQKKNPRALANVLEKIGNADAATVDWDQTQELRNPALVDKTELQPHHAQPDPLVNDQ